MAAATIINSRIILPAATSNKNTRIAIIDMIEATRAADRNIHTTEAAERTSEIRAATISRATKCHPERRLEIKCIITTTNSRAAPRIKTTRAKQPTAMKTNHLRKNATATTQIRRPCRATTTAISCLTVARCRDRIRITLAWAVAPRVAITALCIRVAEVNRIMSSRRSRNRCMAAEARRGTTIIRCRSLTAVASDLNTI